MFVEEKWKPGTAVHCLGAATCSIGGGGETKMENPVEILEKSYTKPLENLSRWYKNPMKYAYFIALSGSRHLFYGGEEEERHNLKILIL